MLTEGTLLGGSLRYRQPANGYRTGIEPVLLAASIPARPGEHVLEAGCGAGAGLLCLAARVPGLALTGLDIAPEFAALAQHNLALNGFDGAVLAGRATAPPFPPGQSQFDHVFANPPWYDAAGTQSPDPSRARGRVAPPNLLAAWASGLAPLLRRGGSLNFILPAARMSEAAQALRESRCGGILWIPLWPRAGEAAKIIILRGLRESRAPDRIEPGLILHEGDHFTPAADDILRHGQALADPMTE
jgi:tRNA1(Val) A37 N6-methylase TrmN6